MCARRKYLRVCGEERASHCLRLAMWEIPPRVRRRDMAWILLPQRAGNTSACAEKSSTCLALPARIRKYLRVCGEEPVRWPTMCPGAEIPPRVRRRVPLRRATVSQLGNTSACAEERVV